MAADERAAVRRAVADVVDSDRWIGGPQVTGFEDEFGRYVGADGARTVGVGNGTDALVLAFLGLGLRTGSAVLVGADDGGYSATAARVAGLVPVAMDTGPLGPTAATAAEALAAAPVPVGAVVVTHLRGTAVPLDGLDAWRRAEGLLLVEDCAQAHGLRVDGAHVGTTGDAATFSFYPTKNLGALGDAGAVVLADPERAARARSLREYGWERRYHVEHPGGRNSRLDPLQAAALRARLPYLDARNARRGAIAARYAELVEMLPPTGVCHHAVMLTDRREALQSELAERGVETAVHYPSLVTEMPGLAAYGASTPLARERQPRILTLPCFPELTDAEVDQVCAALAELS